jgi:NADH dehydrogenase
MAGQIAELAHDTLRADYRVADTRSARVLLVETADRPLTGFPPSLSGKAVRSLERLGVTPLLRSTVIDVTDESVSVRSGSGESTIPARTVIWAAGVEAEGLAAALARAAGAQVDRAGRVQVAADLTIPGHPELFALGDMVTVAGAGPLPGVAPVAMQQGRHVARAIRARLAGEPVQPFRYRDKGNLATIGRSSAVADIKGVHLSGLVAWIAWLTIHLFYLIGFQNRLLVLVRWAISFVTRGRGARLIR